MKPAYLQSKNNDRDRWMVSYVDVLTILLILFVAGAAQAVHNQQKPAPPLPAVPVKVIPPSTSALVTIQRELQERHLEVQLDSRGVVVSLPQALLFAPGEDRINPEALATVGGIADVIGKIPNTISLVGHADAFPIHNHRFSNNWELAAARGLRLLELLSTSYGIPESRLSVESHGSNDPKDTNDTPDGRASNRRVEIVILDTARNAP
jgi:chemotaxis protein MotB